MKRQNCVLLAGIAAVAAVLLIASSSAQSGPQSYKLEGAWTASMPGMPFHWTYIATPTDPSGRKAVIKGQFVVPIPSQFLVPELANQEYSTEFYGEGEMIGADTARVTVMWYGMKSGVPIPEIVNIGVSVSEAKFIGPNKMEVKHRMAFYPPNATGIVTADDTPFLVYPEVVTSIDTRMSLLPISALAK